MENKKVVVALGRNAFSESFPKQQERVKAAAKAIADLVEEKYEVIITHSNGPQVGMIQTAMTEYSRLDPDRTVAPMSICGAMSQGYIGFDLQNAIRTELLHRGIYKPVSTIITQVRVDPFDRAFNAPSKVIGRLMTKEEAENEKKKGNYVEYEEDQDGYRRIIASPKPIDIYEIDAIKALVDAHQLVIAAGGGGMAAGVFVLAAPVAILAATSVGVASHLKNKQLRREKERLYKEALKKHDAIIKAIKADADADKERLDYLQKLNILLQQAIKDLRQDLGFTA